VGGGGGVISHSIPLSLQHQQHGNILALLSPLHLTAGKPRPLCCLSHTNMLTSNNRDPVNAEQFQHHHLDDPNITFSTTFSQQPSMTWSAWQVLICPAATRIIQ